MSACDKPQARNQRPASTRTGLIARGPKPRLRWIWLFREATDRQTALVRQSPTASNGPISRLPNVIHPRIRPRVDRAWSAPPPQSP